VRGFTEKEPTNISPEKREFLEGGGEGDLLQGREPARQGIERRLAGGKKRSREGRNFLGGKRGGILCPAKQEPLLAERGFKEGGKEH